jgi:CHAT domain-containing protein
MVVILDRDEAERLQYAVIELTGRSENFGHPVHWAGLRLEGNFDEVTFA